MPATNIAAVVALVIVAQGRLSIRGSTMRRCAALLAILALGFVDAANAQERAFGGFDCTDDCSGHSAGYKWADRHSIDDESDCPFGNSPSFHEGCIAFTQDPGRGADQDDDGNDVGMSMPNKSDNDDGDR